MIRRLFWLVKGVAFLLGVGTCSRTGRAKKEGGYSLPAGSCRTPWVEEALRPKNRRRRYAISPSPSLQNG